MANNKGYTLIEIMVAVAVFAVVIAAPMGFFVSAIKGQQKALVSQGLTNSISYNLEYISRALRMAKIRSCLRDRPSPSIFMVRDRSTSAGTGIFFSSVRFMVF